jgi:hypothetical protein
MSAKFTGFCDHSATETQPNLSFEKWTNQQRLNEVLFAGRKLELIQVGWSDWRHKSSLIPVPACDPKTYRKLEPLHISFELYGR